jgi:hypothetical protein
MGGIKQSSLSRNNAEDYNTMFFHKSMKFKGASGNWAPLTFWQGLMIASNQVWNAMVNDWACLQIRVEPASSQSNPASCRISSARKYHQESKSPDGARPSRAQQLSNCQAVGYCRK